MKSRFTKTLLSIAFSILGFSFFALPINALELNLKQENTEDRTYVFDVLATPSTEDDLAIQVDIYVADATIKEFKFNEALEVFGNIGTCNDEDSSIIYTQDRVCFAIASEKKFNQGDLLGELTVEAPESGIFTIVRTEGTVYTDGENKFSEEIVLFSNDAEVVGEAAEPQDLSALTSIVIVTIVVVLVLGTVVLYVNRAKIKNDKKLTVLAVIGLGSVLLIGAFSVSQLINSDLAPEDSHASAPTRDAGHNVCKEDNQACINNKWAKCIGGSYTYGQITRHCNQSNMKTPQLPTPSTGGGGTTPRPSTPRPSTPTPTPTPPTTGGGGQIANDGCSNGSTQCLNGSTWRCENQFWVLSHGGCGSTSTPTPPSTGGGGGSTGGGGSQPTGGGGSGSTGGGSQPTGGGGSGSTGGSGSGSTGGGGSTPAPTTSPSCGNLDQNRNGRIDDIVDFASFAIMYRRQCNNNFTPANRCGSKDTNRDGVIDIVDLGAFTRRRSSDPTCANV